MASGGVIWVLEVYLGPEVYLGTTLYPSYPTPVRLHPRSQLHGQHGQTLKDSSRDVSKEP